MENLKAKVVLSSDKAFNEFRALLFNKQILSKVLDDRELCSKILSNEYFIERIAANEDSIRKLLSNSDVLERIFSDQQFIKKFLANEKALETVLNNQGALEKILSKKDVLGKLLLDPRALDRIFMDARLFDKVLLDGRCLDRIISDARILDRVLAKEQSIGKVLGDQRFIGRLLNNDKALGKVLFDAKSINKILDNKETLVKILLDPRALDKVFMDARLFDKVLLDGRCLDRVMSDVRILDRVLAKKPFIDKVLGDQQFIGRLLANEKALEKVFNDQQVLNLLLSDDKNLQTILMDQRSLKYTAGNEMILKKILKARGGLDKIMELVISDGKMVSRLLNHKEIKRKYQLYHLEEKVKRLNYRLPTYLVSFPRAGSNFIQNVLAGSARIPCRSLYATMTVDPQYVLSFKSHALSMEYLLDEIRRLLPVFTKPSKLILLKRDPRDVMISFFEFIQVERNIVLHQKDFLENVCYFYASFIDKTVQRKQNIAPINIVDAFKTHVKNWFEKKPGGVEFLTVKYEDLVEKPESEFGKIFEFLELDCSPDKDFYEEKVSLYSIEPNRERGIPQGWKDVQSQYHQIIEQVNRLLGPEIKRLGYTL